MIIFWVVAGVISAAAAGLILQRAAAAAKAPAPADPALALYRRQLDEIDDLAGRGLLPDDERRGAHAEAARRLLGAADQKSPAWSAGRAPVWAFAIMALAPIVALGLYILLGSPGTKDQPYAARLQAWRAADPNTLAPDQMVAVLTALSAEKPKDPEGFRFLAMAQSASGDASGAVHAMQKAVNVAPQRADLWEGLGEAIVLAADGEVTDDAKAAFAEALKRDPKSMAARFQLARAMIAEGHKDEGLAALRPTGGRAAAVGRPPGRCCRRPSRGPRARPSGRRPSAWTPCGAWSRAWRQGCRSAPTIPRAGCGWCAPMRCWARPTSATPR